MLARKRFYPYLNQLLMDLTWCWQQKIPEKQRAESAFLLCRRHWNMVKNECWKNSFQSEEEEIEFFRYIKPNFTGRIGYYSILYQGLNDVPSSPDEIPSYWKGQTRRFHSFCKRHHAFISYMEKGSSHHDRLYFLSRNKEHIALQRLKTNNEDEDLCTARDHLMSEYFAEKKYYQFVTAHVETLEAV